MIKVPGNCRLGYETEVEFQVQEIHGQKVLAVTVLNRNPPADADPIMLTTQVPLDALQIS